MARKLDKAGNAKARETDALDAELERAARDEPEPVAAAEPARSPKVARTTSSPARSGNMGLLVGLLVVAAGLVALFFFGVKKAAIYAMPVADLKAQAGKLTGRKVRVEGELVPGTLVKRDQPCEYRFAMHNVADKEQKLEVRYAQCVVPDTFRDMPGGGVQVTVEGKLESSGSFEASLVMAKCTSKYDPATHQMGEPTAAPGMPNAPASLETSEPIR